MRLLALIAPALLLAVPAMAEEAAAPVTPEKPVKPKKYCRSDTTTGSIMSRSVCHTKAEWEAIDRQNSADAANKVDLRDRGMTGPGGALPGG